MVSRNSLFALGRLANLAIGLCGFRCHFAMTTLALFGRGSQEIGIWKRAAKTP
jgi:hypothetical protein